MIDESIGKILGMAMAYGVSALGLFLAYVNYRKRTLKAEKVMTPKAWGVVAAVLLTIVGGVLVVAELAKAPTEDSKQAHAEAAAEAAVAEPAAVDTVLHATEPSKKRKAKTGQSEAAKPEAGKPEAAKPGSIDSMTFEDPEAVEVVEHAAEEEAATLPDEERSRWPLIGMLLPAVIFLAATWITAGLYRHFSAGGGAGAEPKLPDSTGRSGCASVLNTTPSKSRASGANSR